MKTLGIWGLGIVGQSVARYCFRNGIPCAILNDKPLTPEQTLFLQEYGLSCSHDIETFLLVHDKILVSAGVDVRPYAYYNHKWISELDFFAARWNKPIIAITGTVGKTTLTHAITKTLQFCDYRVVMGGNVGIGLCDILIEQHAVDYAVLEVSSFQLDLCHSFAPDYAIITNVFPNHLDRHGSLEAYTQAKFTITKFQNNNQTTIIPCSLRATYTMATNAHIVWFCACSTCCIQLTHDQESCIHIHDNLVTEHTYNTNAHQWGMLPIPQSLLPQNWFLVCALLISLNKTSHIPLVASMLENFIPLDHRLQLIGYYQGCAIYNDSKATTPVATQAALHQFKDKSLGLIIGGTSKGVDRKPFIEALTRYPLHKVICFGGESHELATWCAEYNIAHSRHDTIDAALEDALAITPYIATLLFSPSGASYDLFKDYIERGNYFIQYMDKVITPNR